MSPQGHLFAKRAIIDYSQPTASVAVPEVCSSVIRAKVMTQLLSSAFPENNNIPMTSTTSAGYKTPERMAS